MFSGYVCDYFLFLVDMRETEPKPRMVTINATFLGCFYSPPSSLPPPAAPLLPMLGSTCLPKDQSTLSLREDALGSHCVIKPGISTSLGCSFSN